MRMLMWGVGTICGLLVLALALVIVDSSGPNQQAVGMIRSTRFIDGLETTTDVKVGETTVPVQTEVPGAWMVEVDSSVLGRIEVPVSDDTFKMGQHVYLEYHLRRLSGHPEVVGLHLQPGGN
jgi:hypothetical protein